MKKRLLVTAAIAIAIMNGALGESAEPNDGNRLKLELRADPLGASLSNGAPASLVVTNMSKDIVQCDLFDLDGGTILRIQEARKTFKRDQYSEGNIPSRRWIPTEIKPGEAVKKELSLLKLMPNLAKGRHKLRFKAAIYVIASSQSGEAIAGGLELYQGASTILVK